MADATGIKFMAVASFLLLHLHCDESVSEAELCSLASAIVDGYALSKAPAASRVIPLLNLCTAARRLPLPNLAAHAELHLAFALSASRKHVQVEEVRYLPPKPCDPVAPAASLSCPRRCSAASTRCFAAPACRLSAATPAFSLHSANSSLQRFLPTLPPL